MHDAVERFGKSGGGRNVERLVDAGENAAIQQRLQQILGAHVELFRQLANLNALR